MTIRDIAKQAAANDRAAAEAKRQLDSELRTWRAHERARALTRMVFGCDPDEIGEHDGWSDGINVRVDDVWLGYAHKDYAHKDSEDHLPYFTLLVACPTCGALSHTDTASHGQEHIRDISSLGRALDYVERRTKERGYDDAWCHRTERAKEWIAIRKQERQPR